MNEYREEDLIFLFSLPRSGSTLLQSLIAQYEAVDTAAEPWLLLPILSPFSDENVKTVSNFSTKDCKLAVEEFLRSRGVSEAERYCFAKKYYISLLGEKRKKYFLDKTPRYYLIIDKIIKAFPKAKFVFLTRDPIEVFISISNAWWKKRVKPHHHFIDLYQGMKLFDRALIKYKGKSNVKLVQYKDLTLNYESTISELEGFLGLDSRQRSKGTVKPISEDSVMGDKNINKLVNVKPVDSEKIAANIDNPVKRIYLLKYLSWLDDNIKSPELTVSKIYREELKRLRFDGLLSALQDIWLILASFISRVFLLSLLRSRLKFDWFEKLD